MYVVQVSSIENDEITMVGAPFIASNIIIAVGIKDAIRDAIMQNNRPSNPMHLEIIKDDYDKCVMLDDNEENGFIINATRADVYDKVSRFKEFLDYKTIGD